MKKHIYSRICASLLAVTAAAALLAVPAMAEDGETGNKLTVTVTDCQGNAAKGISVIVKGKLTPVDSKEAEDFAAYAVTNKDGKAEIAFEASKLTATVNAGSGKKDISFDSDDLNVKISGIHNESGASVKVKKAATCTNEGESEITGTCPDCEAKLDRTAIVAPLDHKWDSGEITREPTCVKRGIRTFTCKREGCTETTTEYIKKIAHEGAAPVRENEVKATCTKEGSCENVVYCKNCDAEISREAAVLSITDHTPGTPKKENITPATCSEDGSYTEIINCTDCGVEISRETIIEKSTGHTPAEPVKEKESNSTCKEKGSYESVVYCSVCKAELSREAVETAAGEHTPGEAVKENVVKATCTKKGSYEEVIKCTVCDAEISRKTVETETAEHKAGGIVRENEVKATCEDRGSYDEVTYCKKCDEELSREKVSVRATGHTEKTIKQNEVKATCSKTGSYTAVVVCTECDEELSRSTVTTPKSGHTSVTQTGYAATCTEAGLSTGYYCSVCNTVLVAQNTIAATGHKWDSGTVTTAATEDKEGIMTYTCLNNHAHTKTEAIPVLKPGSTAAKPGVSDNGPLESRPESEKPTVPPEATEPEETILGTIGTNANGTQASAGKKGSIGILNILLLLTTIGAAAATFLNAEGNRLKYAAPAPAALAILLFFIGQRFTGRLVFADLWSIPLFILVLTSAVLYFAASGIFEEAEEEPETAEIEDLSDFEQI